MVSLSRARNLLKSLGLVSSEHESSGIPAAEDVFCFSSSGSADDITPESVDEGDQPSTQRKDFWISRSEVDFGPWLNHFVYGLRQFVEAMQPLTSVMEGPGCGESTAAVDMAISLAKDIARSHDRLASVAPKTQLRHLQPQLVFLNLGLRLHRKRRESQKLTLSRPPPIPNQAQLLRLKLKLLQLPLMAGAAQTRRQKWILWRTLLSHSFLPLGQ